MISKVKDTVIETMQKETWKESKKNYKMKRASVSEGTILSGLI